MTDAHNGTRFPPTTDQIRHDISRGVSGEDVAFPDPAAVPLGTDEEAASTPPTRQERAMAAATMPRRRLTVGGVNPAIIHAAVIAAIAATLIFSVWYFR